jgi:glyoxylase-like metal-dependent hydrolase (beta-lactamase superfamily II)
MRRIAGIVAVVLVIGCAIFAIVAYQQVGSLQVETLGDDFFVITGFGGNVGVLRTERGSVVVDTMTFRMQGEQLREYAEALTDGPIFKVINTHYHLDHTHGNPGFPAGTEFIATEQTRDALLEFDAGYWEGDDQAFLPTKTFARTHEFSVGGKTVRVLFLGPGHTGGDAIVQFVEDRVVHFGDLFFNKVYPNIDLEAGGGIRPWLDTLDRALELDFDHAVPGHGPIGTREDVRQFQAFLRELATFGALAAAEGWSLKEAQARAELSSDTGYETLGVPGLFYLNRDFVVRRAWEEATAQPEDAPSE